MGRLWLLGCLAFGLLLAGLAGLNGGILALVIPLVIYLGAVFVYGPGMIHLSAERTLSSSCVSPGTEVVVNLTVVNQGGILEELLVEEIIPPTLELVSGKTKAIAALPPGGSIALEYTLRGKRGRYSFAPAQIMVSEAFGLFRRRVTLQAQANLLILPEHPRLRPVAIRPLRTRVFSGPIPTRQGGSGVNFLGVREYQTGDPLRWINWKLTARHDVELSPVEMASPAFFTNEFEQERVADVGLILDSRQQTDVQLENGSLFEHAVSATAALAEVFLDEGNRVGLLIYGRGQEATFPGYGKIQRERILRALAKAQTGDNLALGSLSYLPTRFFPPHSQIVLISPLSPGDLPVLVRLRAFGYQVLVVSPDPVSFQLKELWMLGASAEQDSRPSSPAMLSRWRSLLTGEGRMPTSAISEARRAVGMAARIARIERTLLLRKLQRVGVPVVDWQVGRPLDQAMRVALARTPTRRLEPVIGRPVRIVEP